LAGPECPIDSIPVNASNHNQNGERKIVFRTLNVAAIIIIATIKNIK